MTVQSAQPAQASQSTQSRQTAEPDIVYTWTDEAPMLATHSFLPIVRGFARRAGVSVGTADISLAGRILAAFSLADDDLARLGELTQSPAATIIKLPNISASLPQLKAAITELKALGHEIPDYPDSPSTPAEREARAAYDAVKGSAVNPVLREGNSDRRAPAAVKAYARSHPHSMGAWSPESRTRVATMESGDFRHNERSVVVPEAGTLQIRLRPADGGAPVILRESLPVSAGEVVDATFMSAVALDEFLTRQVAAAKDEDLLLSVHLKATMMKVSDPLIFGHTVRAALPGVFSTYGQVLAEAGLRAEDGLGSILAGLKGLSQGEEIRGAIEAELAAGPRLSMVDSDRGITNLHVPSDVIIDASMPAMIRAGGHLWGPDGQTADTLAVIPDSSYAGVYQAAIEDCRTHGALDPATMGSVPNVGLMARKAEEYGSHDKTFLIPADGTVEVVVVAGAAPGTVLLSHEVAAGDIWRACTTQDAPIRDWVHLAVTRARATGAPAVFWLDPERGRDAVLVDLVDPSNERLAKLYSQEFYTQAEKVLTDKGVMVTQATSSYFSPSAFATVASTVRAAQPGRTVVPFSVNVPSFGEWGFVLSTTAPEALASQPLPAGLDYQNHRLLDFILVQDPARTPEVEPSTLLHPRIVERYNSDMRQWRYY